MNIARLRKIGEALATAEASPCPAVVDARAIERLRLAVDPELADAKREWEQEQVLRSRYAPGRIAKYDGKLSGYGPGRTGHCGYVEGAGYLGVPAQSSYLERWK